ncbi:prepilin-type N-terminal cleavage/methylation domain-containing protein [Pseudoalteromonas sp. S16_S37]|uniref:prepilin-type N-terminal cleavage/methylation domain-containing protein n=1 Tax=Pseudoalteromonas sp. S16_S37 TaxID=2720228 RepID=UPI001681AC55|nr:prepilin-type N-terminal cleavage/methylation domain-containing protein [Pseudoalteromonas sp. S16_S37]
MIGRHKGFTLVELLISIALLSLVMVTGTFAYFQFASRWDKELGDFQQQAQTAKSIVQLEQVLKGIIPYVIRDEQGKPTFLFIGSDSRLMAVTNNGLNTAGPEVFRLAVQQHAGQSRLVYQSASLENIVLTSTEQSIDFTNKKILLDDFRYLEFNYFGWENLTLKAKRVPGTSAQWFSDYKAKEREISPEYITLKIDDITISATLDNEPSAWKGHFIKTGGIF